MKVLAWAPIFLAVSFLSFTSCAEFPDRKITTDDKPDFTWRPGSVPSGDEYKKSHGKLVEIEGVITRILNKGGTPTLRINDRILCAFDESYIEKLKMYTVGESVVIRGLVNFVPNPKSFDAYLSPAVIMPKVTGSLDSKTDQ